MVDIRQPRLIHRYAENTRELPGREHPILSDMDFRDYLQSVRGGAGLSLFNVNVAVFRDVAALAEDRDEVMNILGKLGYYSQCS